jgi:hypothetical protein
LLVASPLFRVCVLLFTFFSVEGDEFLAGQPRLGDDGLECASLDLVVSGDRHNGVVLYEDDVASPLSRHVEARLPEDLEEFTP